jgi:hypothetical protein
VSAVLALRPREHGLAVSDHSLNSLLEWVLASSAEEVTWTATEFTAVRDWLKTSKAAGELRIKATRLELVALRKVGLAGLAKKLPNSQREVAEWLVTLTEEEFDFLLNSVLVADSPVGLKRRSQQEERAVWTRLRAHSGRAGHVDAGYENYSPYGLNEAIKVVLEDISTSGESFSVAQAADALAVKLGEQEDIPDILVGEPLKEVIRHALRHTESRSETSVNSDGQAVRVPEYVTYTEAAQLGYARVPWETAGLAQFRLMVGMRRRQVSSVIERYEQANRLLEVLQRVSEEFPEVTSCTDLERIAIKKGWLS